MAGRASFNLPFSVLVQALLLWITITREYVNFGTTLTGIITMVNPPSFVDLPSVRTKLNLGERTPLSAAEQDLSEYVPLGNYLKHRSNC